MINKYVGHYYFNKMYNLACFLIKMIKQSIEVFITVKYIRQLTISMGTVFAVLHKIACLNFVVVDNISLMTQLGTLFFVTKEIILTI